MREGKLPAMVGHFVRAPEAKKCDVKRGSLGGQHMAARPAKDATDVILSQLILGYPRPICLPVAKKCAVRISSSGLMGCGTVSGHFHIGPHRDQFGTQRGYKKLSKAR